MSAPLASFGHSQPSSLDRRDFETPRDAEESPSPAPGAAWVPPASPASVRKTKSRAGKALSRTDSLKESKVSPRTLRARVGGVASFPLLSLSPLPSHRSCRC